MSALRRRLRSRKSQQLGYVAVAVALLFPVVFLGCAALGVDRAFWAEEGQRVQRAADAASLAGVVYMPEDFDDATTTAVASAARNGYVPSSTVVISVTRGVKPSQLTVTISSTIPNLFGRAIGTPTTKIVRSATADYTGPAPMGSPCNTFGNEPPAGGGLSSPTPRWSGVNGVGSALGLSPYSNCSSNPQFWADVEGPETKKDNGDRYQTKSCTSSTVDGCTGTTNSEYNQRGYFFQVRVSADLKNVPIQLQLYDPAYVSTGQDCSGLGSAASFVTAINPYVGAEASSRYSSNSVNAGPTGTSYCPGDSAVSGDSGNAMTTSFALRAPTDSGVPYAGAVVSGCVKQYGAILTAPVANALTALSGSYNANLAEVFHNWDTLCTFTPTAAGNYFIQVRTNVSLGGSAATNTNGKSSLIYSGNSAVTADAGNTTTGSGSNAFALRAVPVTAAGVYVTGNEKNLAVSGYDRMPLYANASSASSTFNLIRVLPAAAGQYISFSAFDLGDASGTGTVKISVPTDATGSVTSTPYPNKCSAVGGYATDLGTKSSTCSFTISTAKNNGAVETFSVPIPTDYTCNSASYGGCWYKVTVSFGNGTSVHDVTTWDASIVGDPVRLVE